MKILHLITNYGPGGAQKVFYNLSTELGKDYEIIECAFDLNESEILEDSNKIKLSLDVKKTNNPFFKLFNFYLRIRNLKKIISDHRIDVCLSHMEGANWVNTLCNHHAKKIICIHGSIVKDPNKRGVKKIIYNNLLSKYLYKKADLIIAVSKGIKQELIDLGIKKEKIKSIPNFFYLDEINKKSDLTLNPEENDLFKNNQVIIFSGRLSHQKNLFPLLKIYREYKNKNKTAKLVLVGDGPLLKDLISYSSQIGLKAYHNSFANFSTDKDVFFLGYQDNPYKYIAKAKILILTSFFEGFPLIIGESLICGTPVLSVDCPTGPREILNPSSSPMPQKIVHPEFSEYGVLMPELDSRESIEKNIQTWTTTIEKLISNDDLLNQYSMKGKKLMKDFSMEQVIKEWHKSIKNE